MPIRLDIGRNSSCCPMIAEQWMIIRRAPHTFYAEHIGASVKKGSSLTIGLEQTEEVMLTSEQTEEESILAFSVPDEVLEHAADTNFSLGNCTDARMCQAPNDRPRQPK